MMNRKSLISIIVMIALIAGIISYNTFFKDVVPASVVTGGYRDGISLVPRDYDTTGIAVGTIFDVTFKEGSEMSLEKVKEVFASEPAGEYSIDEKNGSITITPDEPLAKGTLYKFSLGSTSWVYMTESDFGLIGTLPANRATNVPFDTGIEFYFTHQGANVEDYFEIEPKAKGSFESYGNAIVFVPKELEAETIYTVTLKEGLKLAGSEEALKEDYVFSFETSYDDSGTYKEEDGYFNYRRLLNDYATEEAIYIPFSYNIYNTNTSKEIESTVYQVKSIDEAIESLQQFSDYPSWSHFNNRSEGFDTSGLKKVLEFKQEIEESNGYESVMKLEADLEPGYYIIQSGWEDISFETMIQVSDLSAYFFEDDTEQYFWAHDLKTDVRASNLKITEMISGSTADIEQEGVGIVSKATLVTEALCYYKIESGDKETLMYTTPPYNYKDTSEDYWTYLQTDRNLYQPDDLVAYYGFLQHRDNGDAPSSVTVELNEQRWYYWDMWPGMDGSLPLIQETIELKGGFYEGDIELPNLSEGGYEITIKDGDTVLARHYITVEKYVKPDYKMDVTKNKEAIFVGETVRFDMTTSFFEGTPVAKLPVYYNVYGIDWAEEENVTDMDGKVSYSYTPKYRSEYQDEVYGGFNARAILPESGELYGGLGVRIFVNDINVGIETDLDEEKGSIKATVNTITLERLNDGTAENSGDFLDQPVANHSLSAVVYRNEWIKTEIGETYDFINKVVRKNYDYHMETTTFDQMTWTTDANGVGEISLDLPKEDNVHYTVDIKTEDLKNRSMKYNHYFSDYDYFYYFDENQLRLSGVEESYQIGDSVELSVVKGEEPVEALDYMYIIGRTGVRDRIYTEQNSVNTTFEQTLMPNAEIFAVAYTGDTYIMTQKETLKGDYSDQTITLDVAVDKESYKPGETITVDFVATYSDDGMEKPVEDAFVNISIVDEALFALSDQTVETLDQLYRWVNSGITSEKSSHNNNQYDVGIRYGRTAMMDGVTMETAKNDDMGLKLSFSEAVTTEESADEGGGIQTRSEFKDTAIFATVPLDGQGKGTLTFKLPDNVTSWRLTTSAISESLQAGSEKTSVDVTLPFFINPNVNTTYLVGDMPYAGVAGYGSDLKDDESITYELSCDAAKFTSTAKGKAFEKVNLPMWGLEKGTYEITITATTESGLTDGYVEVIEVVDTYQEMNVSDTYDAVAGLTLKTNDYGMTKITFADRTKGMYVPALYNLSYASGKRVDQVYLAYVASQILEEQFGIEVDGDTVDLTQYIADQGGITLLPYSEADFDTTVKMMSMIEKDTDRLRLSSYIHKHMIKASLSDRAKGLYGLALAGESVLLELNGLASVENLGYESYIYIALTYSVLGDDYMAKEIYDEHIAPNVKAYESTARVEKGSGEADYIYNTSIILPLVAKLGLEEAEGMFNYVSSNYSKTYLTSLDRLRYIEIMMAKASDSKPSLSYTYDGVDYEVDFSNYYGNSIKLPSARLDQFSVKEASSNVLIIANYNGFGVIDHKVDTDVTVSRYYEDYETGEKKWNFNQGDIVKVVIDWKVKDDAIDDYYQVVDYAPSGLVPIKNIWNYGLEGRNYWYRDIEGQSVSFGAYKNVETYRPHFYYARVVSPGSFTADATIIQGSQVTDSFNLGEVQTITIEP